MVLPFSFASLRSVISSEAGGTPTPPVVDGARFEPLRAATFSDDFTFDAQHCSPRQKHADGFSESHGKELV
jgi:hypothetical protein